MKKTKIVVVRDPYGAPTEVLAKLLKDQGYDVIELDPGPETMYSVEMEELIGWINKEK